MEQQTKQPKLTPKLITCDIDGTLLHGEQRKIDPAVFAEIRRLKKKGISFCPASGRQYNSLRILFEPVLADIYLIAENGAAIYAPGTEKTLLNKTVMPEEPAMALCRDILDAGCGLLVSGDNQSYVLPYGHPMGTMIHEVNGNHVTFCSSLSEIPEPVIKLAAYTEGDITKLDASLGARWRDTFQAAIAGETWLDFTLADKGTGIRELCRILGLTPAEVMSIGDNYNDLPALELVGYPVIMENAVPELRERFSLRCTRVEELLRQL